MALPRSLGIGVCLFMAALAWAADPAVSFDQVKRLALRSPGEALNLLPSIERAADRAILERLALQRAATLEPTLAARELTGRMDEEWVADILFADALAISEHLAPAAARQLVLGSAARHADAALQMWPLVRRLPYAQELLQVAAVRAPDAAVELLAGQSPSSEMLRAAFAIDTDPRLERLSSLAAKSELPAQRRVRLAFLDVSDAIAANPAAFFHALVETRLVSSDPEQTPALDRGLEQVATALCKSYQQSPASVPEVAELSPRDLYLLLAYARAGDEDTYFARLFDRLVVSPPGLLAAMRSAEYLRVRDFIDYVLWFQRYPRLTQTARAAGTAEILARLTQGLQLERALTAADAIELTPADARLRLRRSLMAEPAPTARQAAIRDALLQSLDRKPGSGGSLPVSSLTGRDGAVLERYFFYDDADGVESFDSFRAQYSADRAWHWEDRGGWVRVWARAGDRRIEIVANLPANSLSPKNAIGPEERARRQQAITSYLGSREPSVVVHRGHAYYADRTVEQLTRSARLVFLGGCRGLRQIREVVEASPRADIISTRAVGTKRVNDPLLKMLNTAILRGNSLDWSTFWTSAAPRFARDADFAGYVPPHRNGAAFFMRAYDALR